MSIASCPGIAYGDGFVGAALNSVDCQALAAPGSDIALVVTGLLTLFVAVFGVRLMLGETPGVRDGVMAVAIRKHVSANVTLDDYRERRLRRHAPWQRRIERCG